MEYLKEKLGYNASQAEMGVPSEYHSSHPISVDKDIVVGLESLIKQISLLSERLGLLDSRLNPIVNRIPRPTAEKCTKEPALSELGRELWNQNNKIIYMNEIVSNLLDELQI